MAPALSIPRLHFTAPQGWLNDPNGLVFHDGYWHLFYQHHPDSLQWGPMHWGHARSRDLTNWEHLPIALRPGDRGAAFSGSAIIDHTNSVGFGADAIVAIYTLDAPYSQTQALAFSPDSVAFTEFSGNPVLPQPEDQKDFRDPKVFRFDDTWVMVLAVGTQIWIYRSGDLRAWTLASTYTEDPAAFTESWGTWETPDLFPLLHPSTGEILWVLTIGMTGAPAGGSGTYYRIGTFDGFEFRAADAVGHWADHGPDFYAAQSWSGTGDRRVNIAWMNNWRYSNASPHGVSRGMMSVARELTLVDVAGETLLGQRPVIDWKNVGHSTRSLAAGAHDLSAIEALVLSSVVNAGDLVDVHGQLGEDDFGVSVDGATRQVRIVRRGPAAEAIEHFPLDHVAVVPGSSTSFELTVVVDSGSVEVFAGAGTLAMAMLTSEVRMPESLRVHTTGAVSVHIVPDAK